MQISFNFIVESIIKRNPIDMQKLVLILILNSAFSIASIAQTAKVEEKPSLESGTIKSQFEYVMKKSSTYEDYKVVKIERLNKFEANVQDSLELFKSNLNNSNEKLMKQGKEIVALNAEMQDLKNQLDKTIRTKNSVSLFGFQLSKSYYNTVMWGAILVLLVVAGICFMLFKRSNLITQETKSTLEEVREEFDNHRKNALVREQKLARKLQDEVIKNKNLGL